jgi:threonine aldolase
MIDLRSDTITKPTPAMRSAMVKAKVGDDVFGEDPTVNRLEEKVAQLFGFEAGLFVPSGTMSNQLSINVLTSAGDEVLIDEMGHVFNYESSAAAHLSSVQLRPLSGHRGKLSPELLQDTVRGANDWDPDTKVVALENSTNKGGGCCYAEDELKAIQSFASEHQLKVHLDGARIWNASKATGTETEFYGTVADTMSVCFSKGLGAPVGSMMLACEADINQARRMRKMWGGGMRQVGMLAAAADHAIEEHWPLLQEDHRRARKLAEVIRQCSGLEIDLESVETNILIFDVLDGSANSAIERLEEEGIQLVPFGPDTLRATFHLQITDEDLKQVTEVFERVFG